METEPRYLLLAASGAPSAADLRFARGVLECLPAALPNYVFLAAPSYANLPDLPAFSPRPADGPPPERTICLSVGTPPELLVGTYTCVSLTGEYEDAPPLPWWLFWRPRPETDPILQTRISVALQKMLVPGPGVRDRLVARGHAHPKRIVVVGHGPPTTDLPAVDKVTRRITQEVYGQDGSYFLCCSGPRLPEVLASYAAFRAAGSEAIRLLVLADDPKAKKRIQRAVKRLGISAYTTVLTELPEGETHKLFAAARAWLDTTDGHVFPVDILRAWSLGIPVVSEQGKILLGAGTRVQWSDKKQSSRALVELTTTPFLASGLVENGRRRLGEFSWREVARRIAEELRLLMA